MLVPVIFVSTAITHLVGGSAGREGAALQIGGGIGYRVGRLLKLDDKDMRLVTLCGMSAVFAALFGTPLTATIFALEVISVGILHYSGLIPCLVASVTAYGVSLLFGIAPMRYSVALAPLEFGLLLRVCVLAVVCALVSIVFCVAMHKTEQFAAKTVKNIYLRAFLGGVIVIVLTLIVGDESYNGIGTDIIASALGEGKAPTWGFLWKIAFTAVTIGFGFKGGEIVPTMFIGAVLGCTVGPLLGIPAQFASAIALVAVFCGAVNCPIASIILSVELFGSGELLYFALACGISYMLSGYFGLYSSQKIMYSKTRAEFINRYAK
jgi:H+/Cl- antiporter ClcA